MSYFCYRSRIWLFHVCFGYWISSPFHLDTLNIPIQNIKSPKNAKNACADIIFPPAFIFFLCTSLSPLYDVFDHTNQFGPAATSSLSILESVDNKLMSLGRLHFLVYQKQDECHTLVCWDYRATPPLPKSLIAWATAFTRNITFVDCWLLHYVKHPPPPCAPPWSCGLASDGTCLDAISLPLLQSDSFPLLQSDSFPLLQSDSLPLLQCDSLVGFSHLLPDPASHHLCLGSPHILAEKAVGWSLWYFHLKQAGNNGSSIKTLERNVLRFNATPVHCTVFKRFIYRFSPLGPSQMKVKSQPCVKKQFAKLLLFLT